MAKPQVQNGGRIEALCGAYHLAMVCMMDKTVPGSWVAIQDLLRNVRGDRSLF